MMERCRLLICVQQIYRKGVKIYNQTALLWKKMNIDIIIDIDINTNASKNESVRTSL